MTPNLIVGRVPQYANGYVALASNTSPIDAQGNFSIAVAANMGMQSLNIVPPLGSPYGFLILYVAVGPGETNVTAQALASIETLGTFIGIPDSEVTTNDAGYAIAGSSAISLVRANEVFDYFNRTGADLGSNWTAYLNGWVPNSGAAHGTAASLFNSAAYTGVTTAPTQSATVVVSSATGTSDYIGVALRINGTPGSLLNGYTCIIGNGNAYITKNVGVTPSDGGSASILATTGTSVAIGDVITGTIIGNTITFTKNLAEILQVNDSSGPITFGAPGVHHQNNVYTLSSFTVSNIGVVPTSSTLNIVADGDSITYGYSIGSPYTDMLRIAGSNACVTNLGVSSKGIGVSLPALSAGDIESMITTGSTVVDTLYNSSIKNIVVLWGGTNDIANGGQTPAQVYTSIQTYIAARHAVGWKVVLVPAMSRGSDDTSMQILNQLIFAGGTGADAIVTLPQSLVATGSYADAALFQADGTHPTQLAVNTMIAPAISTAISSLL